MSHFFTVAKSHLRNFFYPGELPGQMENFPSLVLYRKTIYSKAGNSPYYLVDRTIIHNCYNSLHNALSSHWGKKSIIAYSFKTNDTVVKANILGREKIWAEVVSAKEYALAKKLRFPGDHIIFNGPVKRNEDFELALKNTSFIHIDNMDELTRLLSIVSTKRDRIFMGIRIHGHSKYLKESRFGFSVEHNDAQRAIRAIRKSKNIRLQSIHLHAGTDIDKKEIYRETATWMAQFCNDAEKILSYPIRFLDMGGGYPSSGIKPYDRDDWSVYPIDAYIQIISDTLKRTLRSPSGKYLIVEPGRFLIDDAVVFITQIYGHTLLDGIQKIVTDGAVTMLPLKYYRPQIIRAFTRDFAPRVRGEMPSCIYGASCREDDVMYEGYFPRVETGDFIVYYCVGAYNQSMGSDFIFGKPPVYFIG